MVQCMDIIEFLAQGDFLSGLGKYLVNSFEVTKNLKNPNNPFDIKGICSCSEYEKLIIACELILTVNLEEYIGLNNFTTKGTNA